VRDEGTLGLDDGPRDHSSRQELSNPPEADSASQCSEHLHEIHAVVFETTSDPFVITNCSGVIQDLNAEAEESFGYSRNELVGEPFERLVPERLRNRHPRLREAYHQRRSETGG